MSHLVLFDNEAIQVLSDPAHPKHRNVVSHVQIVANRKQRGVEVELAVPTSVRVEAGWDRTVSSWVLANRLRITDVPLDTDLANVGATIAQVTGVSVADAHLGAIIRDTTADRVTVLTSDPGDVRVVAGDRAVTIVTI
jgi:hypothetical protein